MTFSRSLLLLLLLLSLSPCLWLDPEIPTPTCRPWVRRWRRDEPSLFSFPNSDLRVVHGELPTPMDCTSSPAARGRPELALYPKSFDYVNVQMQLGRLAAVDSQHRLADHWVRRWR